MLLGMSIGSVSLALARISGLVRAKVRYDVFSDLDLILLHVQFSFRSF